MKYIEVVERDGGYVSHLASAERPRPAPGERILRVAASGVNRADLSQIAGNYPPPPGEPGILGLEASGIVEETGEKACALLAGGGHAEYVAVPKGQLFPVPQGLDLVGAAAIPEAFLTAFANIAVGKGETLLVHAGASGVGLAAIQVGKLLGARVAATTRTKEKIPAIEQAGADLAIDTSAEDFSLVLEREWGPAAVKQVIDPIGASSLEGDLKVLGVGGRVVFLATMSGSHAQLDIRQLMSKRARLIGSTLRGRSREEKAVLVNRFVRELLPAFAEGRLRVWIDSLFPPERAAEAFVRMRENRNSGKILIDWTSLNPV